MTVYPDKFLDSSVELPCAYRVIRDADQPEKRDLTPQHLIGYARTYSVPKVIAVNYLSVIASILAENQRADLFAEERYPAETALLSRRKNIGKVATATLEDYLPKDLTIEKIADLRESSIEERLTYQGAIAAIVEEVEKIARLETSTK
jgi:hypothetical protein